MPRDQFPISKVQLERIDIPLESIGLCLKCNKYKELGDGLCQRCWDKTYDPSMVVNKKKSRIRCREKKQKAITSI